MPFKNIHLKHLLPAFTLAVLIWLQKVEAVEIPLLAKNKHSIQLLTVDTTARNVSSAQPAIVGGIDENFPVSITFDVRSTSIIHIEGWSKTMHDIIQIHSQSPQIHRRVLQRQSGVSEEVVTALAADWITHKVYIGVERTANVGNLGKIEVCSMAQLLLPTTTTNAPNQRPVCGVLLHKELDSLHSLVLDPVDGYMYWLNRIHRRIERAWMNGGHHDRHPFHETTQTSRQIALTSGLTLDSTRRALFFIRTFSSAPATSPSANNAHSSEVVMCKLYDRTSCKVVVTNVEAFDLDVFGNFLLWTTISAENTRNSKTSTGLQMCQLNACSKHQIFSIENTSGVESIRVFDSSKQPQRLNPNPCAEDNGKCSHLCLLIPGAPWRSCSCPIGIKFQEDGLRCGSEDGRNLLLVGAAGGLYSISLDTADYIPQPVIVSSAKPGSERDGEYGEGGLTSPNSIQRYADIDFDPVEVKIYWVDRDARAIKRCFLNGSGYEEVATENLSSELNEIAVDWLGRNLVWIMDGRIELMKLDTSSNTIRLAIDHLNGRIFFANFHDNQPKIESILMDGSDRKILLMLPKSSWLSAIELDVAEDCIYWTDTAKFTINRARLSDGHRMGVVARDLKTPYSITKLGSTIFCNSLGGRSLTAIPLASKYSSDGFPLRNASTTPFEIAESEIYGQMSLKAVHSSQKERPTSLCAQANGGCQHICVQVGSSARKCLCSVGHELQEDLLTCRSPAQFLIFSSTNLADDLMRASTTMSHLNLEPMHLPNISNSPSSLALDSDQGFVYWSGEDSLDMEGNHEEHASKGYIARVKFNGTGVEMVYKSWTLRQICGLAVDDVNTGNIFVCNGFLKRIEVISPNGRLRRTVLWQQKNLTNPKFLVIDPSKETMFFANFIEQKTSADIISAPMYGGGVHRVVENAGRVTSLAMDPNSHRLFWSTVEEGVGRVYSLDGNSKATLISQSTSLLPSAMTPHNNQLYLANGGNIGVIGEDGHFVTIHYNITTSITSLVMAHHTQFSEHSRVTCGHTSSTFPYRRSKIPPKKGVHQQQQQQCICRPDGPGSPASRACLCSDQHHYVESAQKCIGPSNFVVLAVGNQLIRYVVGRHRNYNRFHFGAQPFSILPVENIGSVVGNSLAVDWLSSQQYIYWLSSAGNGLETELQLKRVGGLKEDHAKELALEHNCTHVFDIALDVEGRQLFVSCSHARQEAQYSRYGYVHVWRIKADDQLTYIGHIIGGARKSEATNMLAYPKQLVVFSQINALFYLDHNRQLDSPTIVQCQLNGQQCSVLVPTGFSFQYQPLLLAKTTSFSGSTKAQWNRLLYTTTTGLWSRRIEELEGYKDSKMQDIQHHLILDASRAPIETVVALEGDAEDDLSIHIFMTANGEGKTSVLKMENAVRDAPQYVDQLVPADWSVALLQIMNARVSAAAAMLMTGDEEEEEKPMRLLTSSEEEELASQGQMHPLRKHHRKGVVPKSGCSYSHCSHICRPKMADVQKKAGKLALKNDASYYDEEEQQTTAAVKMETGFECLCPLGFSMADHDAHHCHPNIHCASWEFACQDGKSCIHSAKRCDGLSDCRDQSDETSFMCTFPTNPFQQAMPPNKEVLHKGSMTNILKDWSKTWVCDDGRTAIQKYLLCDGNFDCADHSDEFHCRCHNPRDYFDCTAWEHDPNLGKANSAYTENGADCILRGMLCDGKEHCRYGTDERTQLCKFLPPSSPVNFDSLALLFQNGYVIGAALFFLFLVLAIPLYCVCYFCWRRNSIRNAKSLSDSTAPDDTLGGRASSTAAMSRTLLSTTATPHHLNPSGGSVCVPSPAMKGAINTQMNQAPSTTSGYCNYNSLPWSQQQQESNVQTLGGYQSLKDMPPSPNAEYLVQASQPAVMMLSTCQTCSSPTPIFIGQHASPSREAHHQHFVQYYDIGGPPGPQSTYSVVLPAPMVTAQGMGASTQMFYAPPPSAASLSTYGVVQPTGMPLGQRAYGAGAESTSSGVSNVRRRPPLAASTPKHNASFGSNTRRRRRQKKNYGLKGREDEEMELVDSYMPPPAYSKMAGQKKLELNKSPTKQTEGTNLFHIAPGPSRQAKISGSESDSDSVGLENGRKRRSVPSSTNTSSQEDI